MKKKKLLISTTILLSLLTVSVQGAVNSYQRISILDQLPDISTQTETVPEEDEVLILSDNIDFSPAETHSILSLIYPWIENRLLESALPDILNFYDDYTALYSDFSETANLVSISLEMTPASRVLLGLASPFDISWLNTLDLYTLSGWIEGFETSISDIYVNEHKILTTENYFDVKAQTEYSRIPEISSDYLKTDYLALYSAYGIDYTVTEKDQTTEIGKHWPENAVFENFIKHYAALFLKDFNTITQSRETLTVENIEVDCHTYAAQLTHEETSSLILEFLRTIRDDAVVKQFFDAYIGAQADIEYYYESFQSTLDYYLQYLQSPNSSEMDFSLSSKIWLNEQHQLVGRQFSMQRGEEILPFFTLFYPHLDGICGIYCKIGNTDYSYSFSGNIDYRNSETNGMLLFSINDAPFLSVDITDFDHDVEDIPDNKLKGSFTLTMHSGNKDVPLYNPYANFDIQADLTGTVESPGINLMINSAKVPFILAQIRTAPADTDMLPVLPDFSDALDTISDQDMITYAEDADWAVLLQNCEKANIPKEASDQINYFIRQNLFWGISAL